MLGKALLLFPCDDSNINYLRFICIKSNFPCRELLALGPT